MSEPSPKWEIQIHRDPEKTLRKLPKDLIERIRAKINNLAYDPRPSGCIQLKTYPDLYRVRVGKWRITYIIKDEVLIVLVLEISKREAAYLHLSTLARRAAHNKTPAS